MATTKNTASTKKDDASVSDDSAAEAQKAKKAPKSVTVVDNGSTLSALPPTDGKKGDTILLRNAKVNGQNLKAGTVLADQETITMLEKHDGLTMKL